MVQTGLLESPFRSAPGVVRPPRKASKRLRNLLVWDERFFPREKAWLPRMGAAPTYRPRLGVGCDRCHTTRCDVCHRTGPTNQRISAAASPRLSGTENLGPFF